MDGLLDGRILAIWEEGFTGGGDIRGWRVTREIFGFGLVEGQQM